MKEEEGVVDSVPLFSGPGVNLKRKLGVLALGFAESLSVQVYADVKAVKLM